jgi:hypothetical protein
MLSVVLDSTFPVSAHGITWFSLHISPQVVLDLGRRPEARFLGKPGGEYLREAEVGEGQFGTQQGPGGSSTLH